MGNFTTFADLRADILKRAGEDPADPAGDFYDAAGRQLVRGAYEVYNAHPFLFLRKSPPGSFRTLAALTDGTVSLTQDSDTVTFSSPPAASVAGRKLLATGGSEYYRITTHVAGGATAVLDVPWVSPTNAAATYTLYQDEYDLATDVRHVTMMTVVDRGVVVRQRSEDLIRSEYPVPVSGWPARYYARINEQRIRFSSFPMQAKRMEYEYTVLGSDIDVNAILVPTNWRHVLADAGLFWLFNMKDDERQGTTAKVFAGNMEKLVEDDLRKRIGMNDFRPSPGSYA